ncbi:MAG: hypothetical protein COA38_21780 [Fluviicola sp.]|nr:MAG: hypothetical protein COA38_21780 [Fluviicola sp.]
MKVLVLGAQRMHGVGRESGNPYDMKQLFIAAPQSPVQTENRVLIPIGLTQSVIDLSEDGFKQFHMAQLSYPVELDVTTDTEFRNGRAVPVVIGFKQKAA